MQNDESVKSRSAARVSPLRFLLALNAALLMILAAVTFGSAAQGQARGRGEYMMVAGGVQGAESNALYIIDVANQEMIVMVYNPNTRVLEGVGYRHLGSDAAAIQRARTRTAP
jgi:hypothetical protein